MATTANVLNLKQDIIEAAAQTVLAPFNINSTFYKDIVKKVKELTKNFSKTEEGKKLKENMSVIITDIVKKALPIEKKLKSETSTTQTPLVPKTLTTIVNTTTTPTADQPKIITKPAQVASEYTNIEKEQTSFFDSLKQKLLEIFSVKQKSPPKEKNYFVEAQPVFIKEIAPEVYTKLTGIIQKGLPTPIKSKEEPKGIQQQFAEGGLLGLLPKALLPILGGATLILGGLAALVSGFMTQGPAKGVLELIGKVGLKGGLTMLAKKLFTKSLEKVLTKIPIIGSLISFGFAIQRFMNGDITGGFLSLASGLVNLIPGVGFVLSIGIDVIQAILDAKTGGSNAEASAKKSGILLEWAKGLGSLLWKGIKYLPIIGPLFDAVDSYQKGDWGEFTLNLLRSVGQMSGVFYVIDLIDTLTGGNLKTQATQGLKMAGNWLSDMGKWVFKLLQKMPFIGPLIKAVEEFANGNYLKGLKQLVYISPVFEAIGALLGDTEAQSIAGDAGRGIGDIIKNLWTWIKESLWEKVTGFVGSVVDSVKSSLKGYWDNLSLDPRSWVGMTPSSPVPSSSPTTTTGTVPVPVPMKEGGIVPPGYPNDSYPALLTSGETVIPTDKYVTPETAALSNTMLEKIASNTGIANDSLTKLYQAIFKLADVFDAKTIASTQNNIVMPGNSQPIQYPSASQVAVGNRDPIRQVRRQFMPTQIVPAPVYG
jgi:hypothetical protein